MSRSGYSDEIDNWDLIRWRGAVNSAIKGKRGQAFLRELLAALDAMPDKKLVPESLLTPSGGYCALGALGQARGLNLLSVDPEDRKGVAKLFGQSVALVAEIMFMNDEAANWANSSVGQTRRWEMMRAWVVENLHETP